MYNQQRFLRRLRSLKAYSSSLSTLHAAVEADPLPPLDLSRKRDRTGIFTCDIISTCMLPADKIDRFAAVDTLGDGNCMYNAVSMHVIGDASLSTELRCRVVHELVLNSSTYSSITEECSYYDPADLAYIRKVCVDSNYSGMIEIAAVSNIIGCPIHVIYPEVNLGIREHFNRIVQPNFQRPGLGEMSIMITRFRRFHDQSQRFWSPNHFALVVAKNNVKGKTDCPSQVLKWEEIKASLLVPMVESVNLTESDDSYGVEFPLLAAHTAKKAVPSDRKVPSHTTSHTLKSVSKSVYDESSQGDSALPEERFGKPSRGFLTENHDSSDFKEPMRFRKPRISSCTKAKCIKQGGSKSMFLRSCGKPVKPNKNCDITEENDDNQGLYSVSNVVWPGVNKNKSVSFKTPLICSPTKIKRSEKEVSKSILLRNKTMLVNPSSQKLDGTTQYVNHENNSKPGETNDNPDDNRDGFISSMELSTIDQVETCTESMLPCPVENMKPTTVDNHVGKTDNTEGNLVNGNYVGNYISNSESNDMIEKAEGTTVENISNGPLSDMVRILYDKYDISGSTKVIDPHTLPSSTDGGIIYTKNQTLESIGLGWGKYLCLNNKCTNQKIKIYERHCSNMKSDDCLAKLVYVTDKSIPATFIFEAGSHAPHNKMHVQRETTGLYDGILDYCGYAVNDVKHFQCKADLTDIDGDCIFKIKKSEFPTNEKLNTEFQWGHLQRYRCMSKKTWDIRYRNCRSKYCKSKMTYVRSDSIDEVIITHSGYHSCLPYNSPDAPNYISPARTRSFKQPAQDSSDIITDEATFDLNYNLDIGIRNDLTINNISSNDAEVLSFNKDENRNCGTGVSYETDMDDDDGVDTTLNTPDTVHKMESDSPDTEISFKVDHKTKDISSVKSIIGEISTTVGVYSTDVNASSIEKGVVNDVDLNSRKDIYEYTNRDIVMKEDSADKDVNQNEDLSHINDVCGAKMRMNENDENEGISGSTNMPDRDNVMEDDGLDKDIDSNEEIEYDNLTTEGESDSNWSDLNGNDVSPNDSMDSDDSSDDFIIHRPSQRKFKNSSNAAEMSKGRHSMSKTGFRNRICLQPLLQEQWASERTLNSDEGANWGRRQLSNSKRRTYVKKCKGIYKCDTCNSVSKRDGICKNCYTKLVNIKCDAKIYYSLNNDDLITGVEYRGSHSCQVEAKSQVHNMQIVQSLPYDIDGECAFKVYFEGNQVPWKKITDGRPWGRYQTVMDGCGYQRKCLGRASCQSDDCNFYIKHNRRNIAQFENEGNESVCRECGGILTILSCDTKKVFVINKSKKYVLIKHIGSHTCVPIKKTEIPDKDLEELVNIYPHIKPTEAANVLMKRSLNQMSSPQKMDELAATLINNKKIQVNKDKVKKTMYPHGTNFEAIRVLKSRLAKDGHDLFLIPFIQETPIAVLTTSTEKLQIAAELSGMNRELWTTQSPYAHIDFQPSRVKGMTCLGVHCYHPNTKQLVNLFKFYAERETVEVVTLAFEKFNEAIREYTNADVAMFDPDGWMSDESGAIMSGLEIVYGDKIQSKIVTCKKHFEMSVSRLKHKLGQDRGAQFADIAFKMEKTETTDKFEEARSEMECFVKELNQDCVINWYMWWEPRKSHWASSYRPTNNAPTTNLAEAMHAAEKAKGSVGVLLVDALRDDISAAYILKQKLEAYVNGSYKGGTGKSLLQMYKLSESKQLKRAHDYSQGIVSPPRSKCKKFKADVSSTHREDHICDKTGKVRRRLLDDDTTEVPTLSSRKSEKRPVNSRNAPSTRFKKVHKRALTEYDSYRTFEDNTEDDIFKSKCRTICVQTRVTPNGQIYEVKIGEVPSCTCIDFQFNKSQQVCKHIVMALLSLGVEEMDALIYQMGYTETELEQLFNAKLNPFRRLNKISNQVTQEERLHHRLYLSMYFKGCTRGRRPLCCNLECKRNEDEINDGLIVEIKGRSIYGNNTPVKTFKYHLRDSCLLYPPAHSNIARMPKEVHRGDVSIEQFEMARKKLKQLTVI